MMVDQMKVRLKVYGPQFWQCTVEDTETGKQLPMLIDGLTLSIKDGQWTLTGSLLVHEVEANAVADLSEAIETIRKHDGIVRVKEAS